MTQDEFVALMVIRAVVETCRETCPEFRERFPEWLDSFANRVPRSQSHHPYSKEVEMNRDLIREKILDFRSEFVQT